MSSALGSALEPLSHVRCQVYHTKNRELHTVSKAESITTRRQLQLSYEHLRSGMLMTELVVRTQELEQPDEEIFELLRKALEVVDGADAEQAYSVCVAMRLRLAEVMGFGIQKTPCPETWQNVSIDVTDGTISQNAGGIRMSRPAYELISQSLRGKWQAARETEQLEIESFIGLYFSHHLDARITSRAFTALQ